MKKISKDVALATILRLIGGWQKVKVIDLKERYVDNSGEVIFEGHLIDRNQETFSTTQEYAKVVEIRSMDNTTVIYICTAWEALGIL